MGEVILSGRKIEVLSAGCLACRKVVESVVSVAWESAEVSVLDMHQQDVAARARELSIRSVPAVAFNGRLADCCTGRGGDEATLHSQGLGG